MYLVNSHLMTRNIAYIDDVLFSVFGVFGSRFKGDMLFLLGYGIAQRHDQVPVRRSEKYRERCDGSL